MEAAAVPEAAAAMDEGPAPAAAGAAPQADAQLPAPAVAPPEPLFQPGQRVELMGLQSAPERNHTFGTVVGWNQERGRYEVQLESDGAKLRVRPANVVAAPPAEHAAGRSLPLNEDQPFGKQWARQGNKDDVAGLIQSHDQSFRSGRPLIRSSDHLRELMAEGLETTLRTDFCWSLNFTPLFLAHLVFEGFLPICSDLSGDEGLYVLLPKWHRTRCCMKFGELHVSKTARKRAKKYRLTADKCFDEVIDRCVAQHGENWLYPPMRAAFRALHHWGRARDAERPAAAAAAAAGAAAAAVAAASAHMDTEPAVEEGAVAAAEMDSAAGGGGGGGSTIPSAPLPAGFPPLADEVRFHSFEVWSADGTLAAGEFGAVVGGVYTSFTGFFDPKYPGAGAQPNPIQPHTTQHNARVIIRSLFSRLMSQFVCVIACRYRATLRHGEAPAGCRLRLLGSRAGDSLQGGARGKFDATQGVPGRIPSGTGGGHRAPWRQRRRCGSWERAGGACAVTQPAAGDGPSCPVVITIEWRSSGVIHTWCSKWQIQNGSSRIHIACRSSKSTPPPIMSSTASSSV